MMQLFYGLAAKKAHQFWPRANITNIIFMPPTSKKFRGHIGLGLSVCLCVTLALGQEPLEIGP